MKTCKNCQTNNLDTANYCKNCGCRLRMGLKEAVSVCFDKYAVFKGRASRSEFWYFVLFYFICGLVVAFMAAVLDNILISEYENRHLLFVIVMLVFQIVFCLPLISVTVRRLHDIGLSGKWNILHFVQYAIFFDNMRTEYAGYGWLLDRTQDGFKPLVYCLPFIILLVFIILFLIKGKHKYNLYGEQLIY